MCSSHIGQKATMKMAAAWRLLRRTMILSEWEKGTRRSTPLRAATRDVLIIIFRARCECVRRSPERSMLSPRLRSVVEYLERERVREGETMKEREIKRKEEEGRRGRAMPMYSSLVLECPI